MYSVITQEDEVIKGVIIGQGDEPVAFLQEVSVSDDDGDERDTMAFIDSENNIVMEIEAEDYAKRLMQALQYAIEQGYWEE